MADFSVKSRPPLPFKITDQTLLEDWKRWQKSYRCYANAVNLISKSHDVQLSSFKSIIGPQALDIYNTFSIVDTTDVESVIQKFDEHFKPKVNLTRERYKLYKLIQKSGQHFDDFLSDITNQVDKCEFRAMRDEIVLYKVVGGIVNDDVRSALLADENLQFERAVQICRASTEMHFMSRHEKSSKHVQTKQEDPGVIPKTGLKPSIRSKKRRKMGFRSEGTKVPKAVCLRSGVKRLKKRGSAEQYQTENIPSRISGKLDQTVDYRKKPASPIEDRSSVERDSDWRADESGIDDNDDENGDDDLRDVKTRSSAAKRGAVKPPEKIQSFPCEVCGKVLPQKRALQRHRAIHTPGGNFTCHHCGSQFRLKYYLLRHMVRCHSEIVGAAPKMYSCDVCDYKTIVGPNMRRHKFQHSDEKPLSCELCEYRCIVPQLMKAHMAKHTGEKPFVCSVCQKGFTESNSLKKHMVHHMSPEEKERRRGAMRQCNDSAQWMKRSEQTNTACETCGKVFSSKAALKAHIVIHTGEKPYACNVCDYRSGHKSSLITHKMTKHSDEKPFVCNVCGYSCKLKLALQSHMNTHTGDRPYACSLCDSKFKQSAHLSVHMRTHTGEKRFVCDICGHRWANQSNLRQHMKVHKKQSGDPSQYSPPRKRRKKPKQDRPGEPAAAPANAIPQWSEQVSTINPLECFTGLETPIPFQPAFPVHHGNASSVGADCRYFEQEQWPAGNTSQNVSNTQREVHDVSQTST